MTAQNRDRQGAASGTYLITFACYGSWLPGQAGAVDRLHNRFGVPFPEVSHSGESRAADLTRCPSYSLDEERRKVVLKAIQQVSAHRGWKLVAAHVRANHVHVIVDTGQTPEQVMNAFKSYASRALNVTALDTPDRKRWARHGSARYLWTVESVDAAVHYVVCEQGEPMAVDGA